MLLTGIFKAAHSETPMIWVCAAGLAVPLRKTVNGSFLGWAKTVSTVCINAYYVMFDIVANNG